MSCDCDNKKPAQEILGKYKGHGIRQSDYDIKLAAARNAVVEAAKIWYNGRRSVDGIGVDSELFYSVRALELAEQPADPVREFVGWIRKYYVQKLEGRAEEKLEDAEKALGMERK
jgi:hypothetical protein